MTLSALPGKIPETGKIVFNFLSVASPNVAPKPTGQSRSHSIYSIPLQISLAPFFVFDLTSKLRVVHIRIKFKIFIFSKMAPTIFIKLCEFIAHSNLNNMALSAFPGKILVTRIIFLLSSDVRSEGSIASVKIFDFNFFMIFYSTSLPQHKNVF